MTGLADIRGGVCYFGDGRELALPDFITPEFRDFGPPVGPSWRMGAFVTRGGECVWQRAFILGDEPDRHTVAAAVEMLHRLWERRQDDIDRYDRFNARFIAASGSP